MARSGRFFIWSRRKKLALMVFCSASPWNRSVWVPWCSTSMARWWCRSLSPTLRHNCIHWSVKSTIWPSLTYRLVTQMQWAPGTRTSMSCSRIVLLASQNVRPCSLPRLLGFALYASCARMPFPIVPSVPPASGRPFCMRRACSPKLSRALTTALSYGGLDTTHSIAPAGRFPRFCGEEP